MITKEKIKREVVAILLAMVYFAAWIIGLLIIKNLILADYDLPLAKYSVALIGSLILAKVVVLMEHVSFGAWIRRQPAWVDAILRTLAYGIGVVIVLILEKGIEGMRDHKEFGESVAEAMKGDSAAHLWLNTICVSSALLIYNLTAIIRRHLGKGGLTTLLTIPLPAEESEND